MTKSCNTCGASWPATVEYFPPYKNRLRPTCRACERARIAAANRRARAERERDRQAEYADRKAMRAALAGFDSVEQRKAHADRLRALRGLAGALVRVAKARAPKRSPTPSDVLKARAAVLRSLRRGAVCMLWEKPGLSASERRAIRKAVDSAYAVQLRVEGQVKDLGREIRRAIKAQSGSRACFKSLGYTQQQLREHIERQFTDGMSWAAFNAGRIHIDHIVPKASFDLSDPMQWRACWCLSNLRPMWDEDNVAKGAARVFLL